MNYPDGRRYIGQLRAGLRHGIGLLLSSEGNVEASGAWDSDRLVDSIDGHGSSTVGEPQ